MAKNLILYFSHKGENYFGGKIINIAKGNTAVAAEYIQQAVGGDLFEIETQKPYPNEYKKCIEVAKKEMLENARPSLKEYKSDVSAYDTIFICAPCWWGMFPMAVFSQIEQIDWIGKKVAVLMTHEGSGLGNSLRDVRNFCKGSTVCEGLAVVGSEVKTAQAVITAWAKKVTAQKTEE